MWPRSEEQRKALRNCGFVSFMVGSASEGRSRVMYASVRGGIMGLDLGPVCLCVGLGLHTHAYAQELPPNPLPQKREDAEDALMSLNGLLLNDYEMKIG